jgi:hypothetical protein
MQATNSSLMQAGCSLYYVAASSKGHPDQGNHSRPLAGRITACAPSALAERASKKRSLVPCPGSNTRTVRVDAEAPNGTERNRPHQLVAAVTGSTMRTRTGNTPADQTRSSTHVTLRTGPSAHEAPAPNAHEPVRHGGAVLFAATKRKQPACGNRCIFLPGPTTTLSWTPGHDALEHP